MMYCISVRISILFFGMRKNINGEQRTRNYSKVTRKINGHFTPKSMTMIIFHNNGSILKIPLAFPHRLAS